MGQKVNPHGARVGVIYDWSTRWYAGKKDFANNLVEDYKLRKMLKEKYYSTGISHIDIERTAQTMTVNIFTAKPGMIIGRGGAGIEELKKNITEFLGRPCHINVMEIKQPDADAQLVAENIAQQLEKRISFRRAMKQAQGRSMKVPGVKGIKTAVSGRLGGADIARSEHYHEGSIPLQTLRANIDYGFAEAKTTYGRLGVKVWIYKDLRTPGRQGLDLQGTDPAPGEESPRREGGKIIHVNAQESEAPQAVPRPHEGKGPEGQHPGLRRVRTGGHGTPLGDQPAD